MERIYYDNAATTRLSDKALASMMPYLTDNFGNASSAYEFGMKSREAIDKSRDTIAKLINARPSEIYFTSGGTESDNWALIRTAEHFEEKTGKKGHIITTAIEHPAILNTCAYLEKRGFEVTYIKPEKSGLIDPRKIKDAIKENTVLISVMLVNNEIGTIEPVAEIGKIAHKNNIIFHTDAVQAFGHLPINVSAMNIDLLSASAHKFNGPLGVGFLYINTGITLPSLIHGGSQERNRRAGTENVPGLVGMAAAAVESVSKINENREKIIKIRDHIIDRVLKVIPDAKLNGNIENRIYSNVNIGFKNIDGESLIIALDMAGLDASSGSACSAMSHDPSHVLTAIGLNSEEAGSAVRFTLGSENTMEESDRAVDILKTCVERLRG